MRNADERFEEIKKIFEKSKSDVKTLETVYQLAKKLHNGQFRKDGQPYISHPVEVALILARLNFNVDVVSGALLHDVVEDCGYTLEDIAKNFNKNVAEMVDCVSAIDKTKYVFDENEIYEDENFIKSSLEEQTFKKLINIGKKNPLGFAIKFADRLHNLSTIDCFDYNKQLEKVRESQKWIIPIAEKLNSEYFYRKLSNECFKIENRNNAKIFLQNYELYHKLNSKYIDDLAVLLNNTFASSSIKEVKIKNVVEYKVYQDLKELFLNEVIDNVSQGQILKVTNYNIYALYGDQTEKEVFDEVLTIINKKLADKIKIIDAKIGRFTHKVYFQLEDIYRNKFNLYILSMNDYILQKLGTFDGQDIDFDEDNINNLDAKYIKIKTRSGEVKFMPENSTVLDFAFKLHQDFGFGFKYAIINNSKTKQPPYVKLNDGDKVEIVVARDENDKIICNPKLKWFAYVNTDLAKKRLIRYFEKLDND